MTAEEELERLEQTMRDATAESVRHAEETGEPCKGIHNHVVGCWIRQLRRVRLQLKGERP